MAGVIAVPRLAMQGLRNHCTFPQETCNPSQSDLPWAMLEYETSIEMSAESIKVEKASAYSTRAQNDCMSPYY